MEAATTTKRLDVPGPKIDNIIISAQASNLVNRAVFSDLDLIVGLSRLVELH